MHLREPAPVKTVNVIGAVTQIKRQSTVYPALVTEIISPNGRIARMTYDTTVGRGNLKMVRDSTLHLTNGLPTKATTYTYNAAVVAPDSPTQVADVLGRTTTFTYNGMGVVDSTIDPRGHVTKFLYDSTSGSPTRGVVRSITERSVQTWEEQAGTGDDTLTTDIPRDHVTRYGYDDQGNIDSVAAPHGVVTTYDNDTFGRTFRSWDALNTMTELFFDPLNRVVLQRQDSVPQANPFLITLASMACDATQVECADTTTRGFPTSGFPRYADTHFQQGPVGVELVTGPLGSTRGYVYDARGALEREIDEFQSAQIVIPNPAGLTLKTISRTNDTVFYAYDALGRTTAQWFRSRVMGIETIAGDSTSYSYDTMNNVLQAKNSQSTITRTYYADGSVKSRIQTFPISATDTLRYEYNATGQRSKLIHGPDTVTYTYSGTTGDLTTMQVKWGAPANVTRTLSFTWDALGRRRQITYPNGMVVEYRYDKLGTLRRLKSRHPGTPPNGNNLYFTYIADAVDAHGRLLHQKSMCTASGGTPLGHSLCEGATLAPETVNRYNRFGAMVSSQVDANADSLAYDVAGNMTRRRLAGSIHWHTYTMTANTNRLASDASTGASTLSFTYDANGARTLEDHAGGVQHPWKEYYYDGLGRTTGIKYWTDVQPFGVQPAGGSDQCRYDADGQMIKPCDNWSSFLAYDGANVVGVPGLANGTRATFVHGPGLDDPILGVVRFQSDAKELMWVTDGAGRQYAVGGVDGHDPASIAPNIDFSGSSGYWGWQWVGGTKRSYGFTAGRQSPAGSAGAFSVFRNRLYDPATGRWTQEDPIGVAGGANLYQFNGNNPAAYLDPFGLKPCPPDCGTIHAVGAVAFGTIGFVAGAVVSSPSGPGVVVGAAAGGITGMAAGVAAANIAVATADAVAEVATNAVESVRSTWQKVKTLIGFAVGQGESAPPKMPTEKPPEPPKKEAPAPPGGGKSPVKHDPDGTPRITIPRP